MKKRNNNTGVRQHTAHDNFWRFLVSRAQWADWLTVLLSCIAG